ncbi:MAG: hypothetical protein AAFU73_22910 [Planctomycetota bacterium]
MARREIVRVVIEDSTNAPQKILTIIKGSDGSVYLSPQRRDDLWHRQSDERIATTEERLSIHPSPRSSTKTMVKYVARRNTEEVHRRDYFFEAIKNGSGNHAIVLQGTIAARSEKDHLRSPRLGERTISAGHRRGDRSLVLFAVSVADMASPPPVATGELAARSIYIGGFQLTLFLSESMLDASLVDGRLLSIPHTPRQGSPGEEADDTTRAEEGCPAQLLPTVVREGMRYQLWRSSKRIIDVAASFGRALPPNEVHLWRMTATAPLIALGDTVPSWQLATESRLTNREMVVIQVAGTTDSLLYERESRGIVDGWLRRRSLRRGGALDYLKHAPLVGYWPEIEVMEMLTVRRGAFLDHEQPI